MLKFAICDDSLDCQNQVKSLLNNTTLIQEFDVFTYNNGLELLSSEHLSSFDLIFLDIIMDKIDGIEALTKLQNFNCYVIFMSITTDRLRELFAKNVLGFLDKPLTQVPFDEKLNIFFHLKKNKKIFTFQKQGLTRNVFEKEILYFEKTGHYINLYTTTESFVFKENIGKLWQYFSTNPSFIMPNRSFIVNLCHASLATKNRILVGTDEIEVSIGRSKKEETHAKLLKFVSSLEVL